MATERFLRGLQKYRRKYNKYVYKLTNTISDHDENYRSRCKMILCGEISLFIKRTWYNRGLVTLVTIDGRNINFPISLLRHEDWYKEGWNALRYFFRPQNEDILINFWGLSKQEAARVVAGKLALENI